MNVLLDTSPLSTGHAGRGIGTYTRELLKALREVAEESEITLFATHDTERPYHEKDIDLIHYPFFDLFFSTLPKRKKIPVIVTVHDVIPLVFPKEYPQGIRGRWRFLRQRARLRQADAVITDSRCSRDDIVEHLGISPHKISVVPLAASPELQPVSEYYVQKLTEPLYLPAKYVLYIGDINYNKNLPTLLLALTQVHPDIHLVVISKSFHNTTIPEGQALAKTIAANDLEERIHVLDVPTDQPDVVAAVMTRARCLVQPSLYEGFGLPVLEAMQVGTVVVSSNAGSLSEVAGDATILVEPTIAGLAGGIEQAVGLRGDDRQEWIQKGLQRAAEFSWVKTARQTIAVYQQVREEAQRET